MPRKEQDVKKPGPRRPSVYSRKTFNAKRVCSTCRRSKYNLSPKQDASRHGRDLHAGVDEQRGRREPSGAANSGQRGAVEQRVRGSSERGRQERSERLAVRRPGQLDWPTIRMTLHVEERLAPLEDSSDEGLEYNNVNSDAEEERHESSSEKSAARGEPEKELDSNWVDFFGELNQHGCDAILAGKESSALYGRSVAEIDGALALIELHEQW